MTMWDVTNVCDLFDRAIITRGEARQLLGLNALGVVVSAPLSDEEAQRIREEFSRERSRD